MIDIRRIREAEIDDARALIPMGYADPDWSRTYVAEVDGKLSGIMTINTQITLEPLYIAPHVQQKRQLVGRMLCWADGAIRSLAATLGVGQWMAYITDEHEVFQRFVEAEFPVTWQRELPGKWYTRRYNG
jgi:hypothetical protein